jgi:hypothetical protein
LHQSSRPEDDENRQVNCTAAASTAFCDHDLFGRSRVSAICGRLRPPGRIIGEGIAIIAIAITIRISPFIRVSREDIIAFKRFLIFLLRGDRV